MHTRSTALRDSVVAPPGVHRRRAQGSVLLALLLATSACSAEPEQAGNEVTASDAEPTQAPAASGQAPDTSAIELPEDIKNRGTLRIASDTNFPPLEFIPEGETEVIGLDVDIAEALGDVLGIEVQFTNTKFDGIIPALTAGRYDVGMSGINHTEERAEVVDFVDYLYNPGTSLVVPVGNPDGLEDESSLCGHRIGVLNGTVQQTQLTEISKQCETDGAEPVGISTYPLFPNAVVALQSDRIDAVIGGGMPVLFQVNQSDGAFEDVRLATADVAYGIAVPKTSPELKQALDIAFEEISKNGTYAQILEEWGATEYSFPKE